MSGSRELRFSRPSQDLLLVHLSGSWRLRDGLPSPEDLDRELAGRELRRVAFDAEGLRGWDSGLLAFLLRLVDAGQRRELLVDQAGLPEGVRRLLGLAAAVPEAEAATRSEPMPAFLARVGEATIEAGATGREMVGFVGEAARSLARSMRGAARFRGSDFALILQECGAQALPIVTLISFLVGLILAFVGAVQLQQFGAQIFVADLVSLGMAREMGAMMTAVIMAGRTGAAFAAELGTMTVNDEIDAFVTMGISPMDFLVLPRMLALILMMPLLVIYSDLLGILGGAVVGVAMLDLGLAEYYEETVSAVSLTDFAVGLVKGAVFGALVALSGCMRGMQCGRSAQAVGGAATSAVVTAIVLIIVADAILTVIYNVLGI